MSDAPLTCLRCGSDSVIPDVRPLARTESGSYTVFEVGVQKNPAALMLKGEVRSKTTAQVCADCGFVELTAADPEALWQAHLERIANGWTA